MGSERKPINTSLADIVDPDPTSRIDLADCTPGALYAGVGGNIGRVAICNGEHRAGRIAFQGYQVFIHRERWRQTSNRLVPELKEEAYLPTETTGTAFRPTQLITPMIPSLSGDALLDWLIVEDLKQAIERLKTLEALDREIRNTPFMVEELSNQRQLIKLISNLRLY